MPKYYGVERSSEYLAHYGVKGMKWGVRKAIERGSERALDRQWRKANRKLRKLTKLGVNKDKYKKRAIGYGAGAAALGGAALAGTKGIGSGLYQLGTSRFRGKFRLGGSVRKLGSAGFLAGTSEGKKLVEFGSNLQKGAVKAGSKGWKAGKAVKDYGASNTIGQRLTGGANSKSESVLRKITNDQYLRGAAALGAAGLGVAAARNAYRAKTADRNIIRAAQWQREMDRTFAGTKYGKKRRRSNG